LGEPEHDDEVSLEFVEQWSPHALQLVTVLSGPHPESNGASLDRGASLGALSRGLPSVAGPSPVLLSVGGTDVSSNVPSSLGLSMPLGASEDGGLVSTVTSALASLDPSGPVPSSADPSSPQFGAHACS
jgi:hypothetical protein